MAFDQTGIDHVEFLISANPGEPLKPMARVASGGETARLMLALKSTLAHADATPTLIFDEIDQGIGGRVGAIVGQKLWQLTGQMAGSENGSVPVQHQVLCITHLPQLAAFGDQHFTVSKEVVAAARRGAHQHDRCNVLGDDDRVQELMADARRARHGRPQLGRGNDGRGRPGQSRRARAALSGQPAPRPHPTNENHG